MNRRGFLWGIIAGLSALLARRVSKADLETAFVEIKDAAESQPSFELAMDAVDPKPVAKSYEITGVTIMGQYIPVQKVIGVSRDDSFSLYWEGKKGETWDADEWERDFAHDMARGMAEQIDAEIMGDASE